MAPGSPEPTMVELMSCCDMFAGDCGDCMRHLGGAAGLPPCDPPPWWAHRDCCVRCGSLVACGRVACACSGVLPPCLRCVPAVVLIACGRVACACSGPARFSCTGPFEQGEPRFTTATAFLALAIWQDSLKPQGALAYGPFGDASRLPAAAWHRHDAGTRQPRRPRCRRVRALHVASSNGSFHCSRTGC